MHGRHIGVDHHLNEFLKRSAGHPTKFLLSQCRVADEQVHFGGTEELGIGANTYHAVLVRSDGIDAFSRPGQVHADMGESERNHIAHAVRATGRHDVVAGYFLLEHAPLHLDVIACKTPVPLGIDVADPQALVKAVGDTSGGHGHLAGNEFQASARAFMVEENARAGEHVVRLTVVSGDFEGEHFGATVG